MNVFFYAQLCGSENYYSFYRQISNAISELGHKHTDDIIKYLDQSKLSKRQLPNDYLTKQAEKYTYLIKNIKASDIVVVELSLPSFTSGFLMHEALIDGKPVIALYLEGNNPYYIDNMSYERLQFMEYNSSNYMDRLKKTIEIAKKQIDVRFNFFIPPDIITYLNFVSEDLHISKSTYIRDLILKDMKKNRQYQKDK